MASADPDFHDQLSFIERYRGGGRIAGLFHERGHMAILEAEPGMGVPFTQLLALVSGEIDHCDAPPGLGNPRCLAQRRRRILREMEHLMEQHCVHAGAFQWQAGEIAMHHLDALAAEVLEPRPRHAEHGRALVECDDANCIVREQLGHPAGASADVQQMPERGGGERSCERCFHQFVGAVQAAQFVPIPGVSGEILLSLALSRGADRRQPATVGYAQRAEIGIGLLRRCQQAADRTFDARPVSRPSQPQENPAPLAPPFAQARIAQDRDVAGHARLALAQNLRDLAHGEFHRRDKGHDAQPRGIGQCAQDGFDYHRGELHIKIFTYLQMPRWPNRPYRLLNHPWQDGIHHSRMTFQGNYSPSRQLPSDGDERQRDRAMQAPAPFSPASFPPAARATSHGGRGAVEALLTCMTLEEKLAQLDLLHSPDDPGLGDAIARGRVGGVAGAGRGRYWQTLATWRCRLGIPLLLVASPRAPAMGAWALAATWDEELATELGRSAARRAIEAGFNCILGPRVQLSPSGIADSGEPADIATTQTHLAARLAEAYCRGARAAGAAVIAMNSFPDAAAGRIESEPILPSRCARILAIVASARGAEGAPSREESARAAIAAGHLSEATIDDAVRRVLGVKESLGLSGESSNRPPLKRVSHQASGEAACTSAGMVLLRNQGGLLPFSPGTDRVLLVGATDGAALSCAAALSHAGVGYVRAPGLALRGPGESWTEPVPADRLAIALTRDAAQRADFLLVALDERHFEHQSGRAWRLPTGAAMALVNGLASYRARMVALIATTDPVDLAEADRHFAAVLACWDPAAGLENRLGDILSGRAAPQGRMPAGTGSFAFGQGMGYGETQFSAFALRAGGDHVEAELSVRNTGTMPVRETVQFFRSGAAGESVLLAFRNIVLAPGECVAVRIALAIDALGAVKGDGSLAVAAGPRELYVGKDMRRVLRAEVNISPALARGLAGQGRALRLAG